MFNIATARRQDGAAKFGVRPPDMELRASGELGMPIRVRIREFLGEDVLLTLDAQGNKVRMVGPRHLAPSEGDNATVAVSQ
jgi:hypothetical protein